MKLPNFDQAIVPEAKLTTYLLSLVHPRGKAKAAFFTSFGFSLASWETLAKALQAHVSTNEVAKIEPSPHGVRYIIEGVLFTPDGRNPLVRSVWFISHGNTVAALVTAYPLSTKRSGR